MTEALRFLVIDGYSKESRDELQEAGMSLAWKLYVDMLATHLPDAAYDILLPSDPGVALPASGDLKAYAGIIWTGCNLCVNDADDASVSGQIALAGRAFEVGVPSFGSCWALQIAAVAAGGQVAPNPQGREMGMARKIRQTPEGVAHPMFKGKPPVFEGFASHDDIVTKMPLGSVVLAGNDMAEVQAAAFRHKKGVFWATQYHPEYTLHEMARLMVAREEKLIKAGFFRTPRDLMTLVDDMEALAAEPERKDLRWRLAIDDDVLSDPIRQCEFANWLFDLVLPNAGVPTPRGS